MSLDHLSDVLGWSLRWQLASTTQYEAPRSAQLRDEGSGRVANRFRPSAGEKLTHIEVTHQRNVVPNDLARLRQVDWSVQAQNIESAVGKAGEGCSAVAADVQEADAAVVADVLREGLQPGQ